MASRLRNLWGAMVKTEPMGTFRAARKIMDPWFIAAQEQIGLIFTAATVVLRKLIRPMAITCMENMFISMSIERRRPHLPHAISIRAYRMRAMAIMHCFTRPFVLIQTILTRFTPAARHCGVHKMSKHPYQLGALFHQAVI